MSHTSLSRAAPVGHTRETGLSRKPYGQPAEGGFAACGDDDENGDIDGNPSELLVGTWEAYDAGGYDIIDGVKDEYHEENIFGYYEFKADGTGATWDYDDMSDLESFTWSMENNRLTVVTKEYSGDDTYTDEDVFTIEALNKGELRISETTVDDDGDTFYEWTKLRRVE